MLIISISLQAQQRTIEKVYFECNKSFLDSSSQEQLDKTLKKLSEQRIIKVRVLGHTDSDGKSQYNEKLSKERASAVSNHIISKGISSSMVKVDYYGEAQPVVVEKSEALKRENRRVVIIFEFVDLIIPKEFQVSSKVFKVNPDRDTVLKINSKGTKLHIPKDCFVDNRGIAVHDNVTLRY